MKTNPKLLCAVLSLLLLLTACSNKGTNSTEPAGSADPAASSSDTASPSGPADSAGTTDIAGKPQEEIEDWRAEQKIVIGENSYQFLARALFSEEGDPLTARLESDVQLTDTAVILGTSDYGGMFNGQEMTIPSQNIVIDLNGYTLTAEKGCAVFEVQEGYTLTVVDNSEARTGKLEADGEAVIVEDGGAYIPLSD